MKSLKVLCTLGILSLFFSCSHQEDTAAFFINNQLNEDLIIHYAQYEGASALNIQQEVELDLTSSEAYEKYILRLTQLEVVKFECGFSNYMGVIENGKLYLDNLLLGDFNPSLEHISIEDEALLSRIADLFLEKTSLDFSFVGQSDTTYALTVSVDVEMKGTFVH